MEHQDWETYIIHCKDGKKTTINEQEKTPEVKKKNTGVLQKDTKL